MEQEIITLKQEQEITDVQILLWTIKEKDLL